MKKLLFLVAAGVTFASAVSSANIHVVIHPPHHHHHHHHHPHHPHH